MDQTEVHESVDDVPLRVLGALYEFLRGFQAADEQLHGELLRDILARDPNLFYAGLLTYQANNSSGAML